MSVPMEINYKIIFPDTSKISGFGLFLDPPLIQAVTLDPMAWDLLASMLQGWSVVPHVRGLLHWSGSHLTALHLVNQPLLPGFCCVWE